MMMEAHIDIGYVFEKKKLIKGQVIRLFNIGDIVRFNLSSVSYEIKEIDTISSPLPRYKLADGEFEFWDYCFGWEKVISLEEVLENGKVLTDDAWFKMVEEEWKEVVVRIRTFSYKSHIYYCKTINNDLEEFKELK